MALGFVLDSSRFSSFFSDLFNDLKSSRRFQVATVLWLPLWVTAIVLLVRFGERNTIAETFREWGSTFIPESTLQYPDVEMIFMNPPTSVVCKTFEMPYALVDTTGACTDGRSWNSPLTCKLFKLSAITAKANPSNNFFGNPIRCFMEFPADPFQNVDMFMLTPGGFNTSSAWNVEPTFIRPNLETNVELTHQLFFPADKEHVDVWNADVHSTTSVFANGFWPYNATLWFRIPFGAIQVNYEMVGFDRWFLMAMWGGGLYFMYFIHMIAFSLLKFILPQDSRLLKGAAPNSEYTPLK